MGFRTGSYATVWEVNPKSEAVTIVRISTSRKLKGTDEYVQDFSGYVAFVGKENAAKAAKFHEKDHIKLGDIDVTTKYDKEKKVTYTNFSCFSFEMGNGGGSIKQQSENPASEGENPNDGDIGGDGLPF